MMVPGRIAALMLLAFSSVTVYAYGKAYECRNGGSLASIEIGDAESRVKYKNEIYHPGEKLRINDLWTSEGFHLIEPNQDFVLKFANGFPVGSNLQISNFDEKDGSVVQLKIYSNNHLELVLDRDMFLERQTGGNITERMIVFQCDQFSAPKVESNPEECSRNRGPVISGNECWLQ